MGYITPGLSKVFWVTTLTSTTSPSAAEINAGTELTSKLRGIPNLPRSGNTADDSDLSSAFEKRIRATVGGDTVSFDLKREKGTETEYSAMSEGDNGYLVVFRKGTAGSSPASGDVCDVYPVQVLVKSPGQPGRNDVDFETVECTVTADPSRDVTVAA